MIHLNDVCVQFKDKVILNGIRLAIPPHQAFALVGPSGAGKSVLLKVIAGLIEPTSGTVEVHSNRVSMLFQKNALFDSFTSLENLLTPLEETLGVVGEPAREKAIGLLNAVGLSHAIDLYPDELSGGMQKRLGIARALAIDPEVILYDEPTAGLDPVTSKIIAELMIDLHKKTKTTLVMVTNDLQRAYQVADRIAYIGKKRFEIVGTPKQIQETDDPEIRGFIYGMTDNLNFEVEK